MRAVEATSVHLRIPRWNLVHSQELHDGVSEEQRIDTSATLPHGTQNMPQEVTLIPLVCHRMSSHSCHASSGSSGSAAAQKKVLKEAIICRDPWQTLLHDKQTITNH